MSDTHGWVLVACEPGKPASYKEYILSEPTGNIDEAQEAMGDTLTFMMEHPGAWLDSVDPPFTRINPAHIACLVLRRV